MKHSLQILSICATALLLACSTPQKELTTPQKVAEAYGYDNFDKVNSIAYTWNVQAGDIVRTRDWKWNIKDRTVYYADADTSYTYSLDLPKEELPKADAGFINDKYWLMYPFHLIWDTGYTYEESHDAAAPISGKNSIKLSIVYNNIDGYTPGDAYDLYLNEAYMIQEWVFRKGNSPEGRAFTWEAETTIDGVTFATEHFNADRMKFIWFTDIIID